MSFSNQTKNSSSFSAISKNSSTFSNQDNIGSVGYITTDTPDYVLVGSAESEFLVWRDSTSYQNQTKN